MSIKEQLMREIDAIKRQRHQFLLICLQKSSPNDLLNAVNELNIPVININVELAKRLNQIPSSRRPRAVKDQMNEMIHAVNSEVIFIDRMTYLFDPELKQDPIGLIEYVSGNRVVLVLWPGTIRDGVAIYGEPGHPEYYERENLGPHLMIL